MVAGAGGNVPFLCLFCFCFVVVLFCYLENRRVEENIDGCS